MGRPPASRGALAEATGGPAFATDRGATAFRLVRGTAEVFGAQGRSPGGVADGVFSADWGELAEGQFFKADSTFGLLARPQREPARGGARTGPGIVGAQPVEGTA